jgi:hypothetical protein
MEENPLSTGLKRYFQGYGKMDSFKTGVETAVTGFTGTFLNQIRQLTDNYQRDTKDTDFLKELVNVIKNKVPVLSKTLPKMVSVTGQEKEGYQNNSNSIFNVFVNPAFVSSYNASPGLQLVLDLYEKTGSSDQAPREVAKSITINKIKVDLTKDEINDFQKAVGQRVMQSLDGLANNPVISKGTGKKFEDFSEEDQVKYIAKILNTIADQERAKMIPKLMKDQRYTSQIKKK